jgi:hypothetical protein
MLKRFFKYIEPLWQGNDKKVSLRSVAAIALIVDLIINIHRSAGVVTMLLRLVYKDKTIDPALVSSISGNLAQIAMILGIEAALIAAMLALKTYQNNVFKVPDSQPAPPPIPDGEVK